MHLGVVFGNILPRMKKYFTLDSIETILVCFGEYRGYSFRDAVWAFLSALAFWGCEGASFYSRSMQLNRCNLFYIYPNKSNIEATRSDTA